MSGTWDATILSAYAAEPGGPFAVDAAVSFEPRTMLASYVRRSQGSELCGAGGRCTG